MFWAWQYGTVFLHFVRWQGSSPGSGFLGASRSRLTGTSGPHCSPGDDYDGEEVGDDDDDGDHDDDDKDEVSERGLTDMASSGRPLSSLAAKTAGSIDCTKYYLPFLVLAAQQGLLTGLDKMFKVILSMRMVS